MKKDNTKSGAGFTLIEVMVAISILLIAVVAPMSIIGGSLSQIASVRDQTIAVNLAQEGIEVVRQIYSSNLIARWTTMPALDLDTNIEPRPGNNPKKYIVNVFGVSPPQRLIPCTGGSPPGSECTPPESVVYTDGAGYMQGVVGISQTQFSRTITISGLPGNGTERIITSTVTWKTSAGDTKIITVSESIFAINN